MTSTSLLATALAILCVASIGVSATTLESSVRTDPDDVIDLDWEHLPVGEESVAEVKREIGDGGERATERAVPGSGDREQVQRSMAGDTHRESSDAGAGDRQSESAGGDRDQARSAGQQPTGPATPDQVPWNLLWLLAGLATLAGLVAVWYRYADGVDPDAGPGGADGPAWPPGGQTTEVDRAWLAMVDHLDVDRPWARTPAEFADAAVEAGLDPAAVEGVTDAFVDVRYGGSPVTAAHRARARAGLLRLQVDAVGGRA